MAAVLEAAPAPEIRKSPGGVSSEQWLGFTGMVFGIFMAVLDIQIVASSLEQIQAGLSATREEITWVQTAYLVAEVVVIPLSGWLGRALSTRYLFALACGGFTLMSLCCALAWNLPSMVVFRAFQGLFGGAMIPSVFAMIYTLFPPRLQPVMGIVVGMVVTVAPTAGPVLGGYLTEVVSWKALFLINLLPGLLVTLSTWLFLKVDDPDWTLLNKIDFLGILYIVIFLGSVQFVLEEGVKEEWFESREIVFFTVAALASGIAMFYRELTIAHPIVDLWAFRNRNFAVGCIFSFILGCGLYTIIYLMPVYLASVKGLNSLQIGRYVMVTGLFQFISAFAGRRTGESPRFAVDAGFGALALRPWLLAERQSDARSRLLGIFLAAGIARLCDDVLFSADQHAGARHIASGRSQERERALQPDAQPGRRDRPCGREYADDPAEQGELRGIARARHGGIARGPGLAWRFDPAPVRRRPAECRISRAEAALRAGDAGSRSPDDEYDVSYAGIGILYRASADALGRQGFRRRRSSGRTLKGGLSRKEWEKAKGKSIGKHDAPR